MQIQALCAQQINQLQSEIQRLRQFPFSPLSDKSVHEIATLVFQQMSAAATLRVVIGTSSLDEVTASIISFQDAASPSASPTPVILQDLSFFPQGKEALLRVAKTVFCMISGSPKTLQYAPPLHLHPSDHLQPFPSIDEISRFISLFSAHPLKCALTGCALEKGPLHGLLSNLWNMSLSNRR